MYEPVNCSFCRENALVGIFYQMISSCPPDRSQLPLAHTFSSALRQLISCYKPRPVRIWLGLEANWPDESSVETTDRPRSQLRFLSS